MDDSPRTSSTGGFIPAGPADKPESVSPAGASPGTGETQREHLVRIEEKVSRVEDKYARSEGLLGRIENKFARSEELLARLESKVEGTSARLGELARQSEVAALRSEVRGIGENTGGGPGIGTILLTAVFSAILTAALMVAIQRYRVEEPVVHFIDPYIAPYVKTPPAQPGAPAQPSPPAQQPAAPAQPR